MPRKENMDGPVSMRISVLRDLKEENLTKAQIEKMLLVADEDKKIDHVDGKLVSYSTSSSKDPIGVDWTYQHRSIYADGIYFTMTIGTVKGRESEPQCKELNDSLIAIITSLARKPTNEKMDNRVDDGF